MRYTEPRPVPSPEVTTAIRGTHTRAILYCLSNDFTGQELDNPAEAWQEYDRSGLACLLDNRDGTYTMEFARPPLTPTWIDLWPPLPA